MESLFNLYKDFIPFELYTNECTDEEAVMLFTQDLKEMLHEEYDLFIQILQNKLSVFSVPSDYACGNMLTVLHKYRHVNYNKYLYQYFKNIIDCKTRNDFENLNINIKDVDFRN